MYKFIRRNHRLCADPNGPGLIPDPEAKLEEPLVVRPTSETIIWNMFGKWIASHRGTCVGVKGRREPKTTKRTHTLSFARRVT